MPARILARLAWLLVLQIVSLAAMASPPDATLPPSMSWVPPRDEDLLFGQGLERVSATFLGAPYRDSALGEGEGQYDPDPLARLDAFDCTTFVETVWAISRANDKNWRERLREIRYKEGKVGFFNRLHFIERDWIPFHQERGLVEDLTSSFGFSLLRGQVRIDRTQWLRRYHPAQLASYRNSPSQEAAEDVPLSYIPYATLIEDPEALSKLRTEIQKGALVGNFVRLDGRSGPGYVQVTHQGLVLLKGQQLVLRHASTIHRRVMDVDFLAYIKAQERYSPRRGFQLLRLKRSEAWPAINSEEKSPERRSRS